MILYKTVEKEGKFEELIEKSRFIAHISPVRTKEEADAFISKIREEHKTATHNVPAFVLGEKFQHQWASDDGEPQGTSGAPIINLLVSKGITNVAVVVTRYYGGIKLGTGGLVRAYTKVAKAALDEVGIIEIYSKEIFLISFDYSYLKIFQNMSQNGEFDIVKLTYKDRVEAEFSTIAEKGDILLELIKNVTNGQGKILKRKIMETR